MKSIHGYIHGKVRYCSLHQIDMTNYWALAVSQSYLKITRYADYFHSDGPMIHKTITAPYNTAVTCTNLQCLQCIPQLTGMFSEAPYFIQMCLKLTPLISCWHPNERKDEPKCKCTVQKSSNIHVRYTVSVSYCPHKFPNGQRVKGEFQTFLFIFGINH